MSLQGSVRRLTQAFEQNTGLALQGSGDTRACRVCKGRLTYYKTGPCQRNHAADCPVLALPRIVTALQAAEQIVGYEWPPDDGDPVGVPFDTMRVIPAPLFDALVVALRGETE